MGISVPLRPTVEELDLFGTKNSSVSFDS